jgi:hypothetical protein
LALAGMGALLAFVANGGAALAYGPPVSNLVVNGDFSAGDVGFTTGYTLSTQSPDLFENGVHGIYAVIPIGSVNSETSYGDWTNVATDPQGGDGNVFVADAATDPNVTVWSETLTVNPYTNYTFSFDAAEISNACCSNAVFVPTVSGATGAALTLDGAWQQNATFVWNSGSDTSAVLSLTDTNTSGPYNDFVLTNVSFTSAAPEPAAWFLMIAGIGGVGLLLRRAKAAFGFRGACASVG